jgi:hypothetical protein
MFFRRATTFFEKPNCGNGKWKMKNGFEEKNSRDRKENGPRSVIPAHSPFSILHSRRSIVPVQTL